MEKIRLRANLERVIAHTEELEAQMGDITYAVTIRARANLAKHRRSGEHKVTQTKGQVDHYVNLIGPAALSLEEGHFVKGFYHGPGRGEWKFVQGLHILRDAIRGA